jgi:hypothetical protein
MMLDEEILETEEEKVEKEMPSLNHSYTLHRNPYSIIAEF